jgi:hypothetical protein
MSSAKSMVNTDNPQSDNKIICIQSACSNNELAGQLSGSHLSRTEHLQRYPSDGARCSIIVDYNLSQDSPSTHQAETTRLPSRMRCPSQMRVFTGLILIKDDRPLKGVENGGIFDTQRVIDQGLARSFLCHRHFPSAGARALNRSAK